MNKKNRESLFGHDVPDTPKAEAALKRILASPGFVGAERLAAILTYLVQETLAGRASRIRAKTIGLDVYGYSAREIEARESTVRVDAGRLRRKLATYYDGDGAGDTLRIDIPKGTYTPVFTRVPSPEAGRKDQPDPRRETTGSRLPLVALASLGASIAIALAVSTGPRQAAPPVVPETSDSLERAAIFDLAPGRLQAFNLAEQGRDLIFPAVDPRRLQAAQMMFEAAIEADPDYFGGHAGVAQIHATRAILTSSAQEAGAFLERARLHAERALALAPEDAWSLTSQAWIAFASGERETALRLSRRALALRPSDPHVAEFGTLIALYSGQFERVVSEVDRLVEHHGVGTGFVFQNAKASALFHLGDYEGAIAAMDAAIEGGGPYGPVIVAYLMAAHHALGHAEQAGMLAEIYNASWPNAEIDALWNRLFDNPAHSAALIEGMAGAMQTSP